MSDTLNVDTLQPPVAEPTPSPAAPGATPPVDAFELEVAPGKREKFTREQLLDFYKGNLRQQDYTRKTQELAAQRAQVEQFLPAYQQMLSEREQLAQFLNDRKAIAKYLAEAFEPEQDPNEALTRKSLEDTLTRQQATQAQRIQELERQLQYAQGQTREALQSEITNRVEELKYSMQIDPHVKTLFKENPVLELIPNAEDVIRFQVFQMQPQTIEETLNAFSQVTKGLVEKLGNHFKATAPEGAGAPPAPAKKVVTPEPPGGLGSPAPQPTSFKKKDGSIDWDLVEASAKAFLKQVAEQE